MSVVLVVAPHPDDETLGCGGALLRHRDSGDPVHWVIATEMTEAAGFSEERILRRDEEIRRVADRYGFQGIHRLGFETTRLDSVPLATLIERMSAVVHEVRPEVMYLPYRHDVHTDHARVFDAAAACTKWFRYPHVRRVLAYETLSETDFQIDPDASGFRPNVYVDIGAHLATKIEIMSLFASEIGQPPFPRSEVVIRALATVRGAAGGYSAAEAFVLLKERID